MLLTELELMCFSRGTFEIERSIGSVTWVETSCALAPGMGVITTRNGNWMSGSSSCFMDAHENAPPRSMASVTRTVTLLFPTASFVSRITGGLLACSCLRVGWQPGHGRLPGYRLLGPPFALERSLANGPDQLAHLGQLLVR